MYPIKRITVEFTLISLRTLAQFLAFATRLEAARIF